MLFRLALVGTQPKLSDDYLRYVFDGRLVAEGISPYRYLPLEIAETTLPVDSATYELITSKNKYSIYPPVSQYLFGVAVSIFPDSLDAAVVILKAILWIFEFCSIFLIILLLGHFKKNSQLILIYALNPLVIFEFIGGLHMDAVMVSFTLLAVWLLCKNKWVGSAITLGFAICVKMLPLIFLVFLMRYFSWQKLIYYGLISMLTVIALFAPIIQWDQLPNMLESFRLYFDTFEFNASIYYVLRWIGFLLTGFNQIALLGPMLSILTIGAILHLAGKKFSPSFGLDFINKILLGLSLYFIFSTTVNPWYIAPLVAFSLFSNYKYALAWSAMIPLSYVEYSGYSLITMSLVLAVEYLLVFVVLMVDMRNTTLIKSIRLKWIRIRAGIKVRRIHPILSKSSKILDLGSGNGGVCHALQQAGFDVTPVDVVDKSFFISCRPVLYDGKTLPFANNSFDTVLLLTMLHHTPHPEEIIIEAARVSGNHLIVMEDVFSNRFQKWITMITDSLVNWEFKNHPHTNMKESEWELIFNRLSLNIRNKKSQRFLLFFRQTTWLLEKSNQ